MKIEKNCKICEKKFISYDVGKRIKNVFCSFDCKSISQEHEKTPRLDVACIICHKICQILPYRKKEKFYCSRECQHESLIFWKNATDEQKLEKLNKSYHKYVIKKNECWDWDGAKNKYYGVFSYNRKIMQAHRASWIIHNGKIPEGMHILHKCDNPPCSKPEHLFLGTHKDNMYDMRNKKLHNQWSKLNAIQVSEIKKLINEKTPYKEIMARFSISAPSISDIKYNRTWQHIA